MTNSLIERYKEKLMKLTLFKGIDEKCQIHNATTYAKKETYQEIIKDLEELKMKQLKAINKFHQIVRIKSFNELYEVCIEFIKQTLKDLGE